MLRNCCCESGCGRKEEPQGLSEFSQETQPRKLLQGEDKEQHELVLNKLNNACYTKKWKYNNMILL
jgi:hypothetical protein